MSSALLTVISYYRRPTMCWPASLLLLAIVSGDAQTFHGQQHRTEVISADGSARLLGSPPPGGLWNGNEQLNEHCEPIRMSLCDDLQYNMTIMPNLVGHNNQDEAGQEAMTYFPLVKVGCSPYLKLFLCSVYVPMCSLFGEPLMPCRSLCQAVKPECEAIMNTFKFTWPAKLNCSRFPEHDMCFGPPELQQQHQRPHTSSPRATERPPIEYDFACPETLRRHRHAIYFSSQGDGQPALDCGFPCSKQLQHYSPSDEDSARRLILYCACLALFIYLFSIGSLLLGYHTAHYPERPIFYIALCHACLALLYVVGYAAERSVVCDRASTTMALDVVWRGNGKENLACTFSFLVSYVALFASQLWWTLLCLTWFLTATLKWSTEAIDAQGHVYHFAAWGIPTVLLMAIVSTGEVEGDLLVGLCTVGALNPRMRWALIVPQAVALAVGLLLLPVGCVSIRRVQTMLRQQAVPDDSSLRKLVRLKVRLGVLAAWFVGAQVLVLGILLYQQLQWDEHMRYWRERTCEALGVPCPLPRELRSEPSVLLDTARHCATLLLGVPVLAWTASPKVLALWWRRVVRPSLCVVCCCCGCCGACASRDDEEEEANKPQRV